MRTSGRSVACLLGSGLLAGFYVLVAAGCGGSPQRRLSEREALALKQELVEEHREELSPRQEQLIFLHPARTEEEIEAIVERFVEESRRGRLEPAWSAGYVWGGEARTGRYVDREGRGRVRLSEMLPLPEGAGAVGIPSSGGTSNPAESGP